MLPCRLFRQRNFSFANLETLFVYAALSSLFFFLTIFLQQVAGYSALEAGLAGLPVTVADVLLLRPRRSPLQPLRAAPVHGLAGRLSQRPGRCC